MAGWNGVYTKKGLALLAKLSDGGSLDITRAVSGTGVVAEEELINQTAVTGIKQELSFQPPSYPESNVCKLPVVLTNAGLGAEYTAHQIGIYAKDPDVGEILYFITQSEVGTNIVRENDIKGYTATWIFYFNYGQADNVNVTVDPSNAVTIDMLEEVRILAERGVSTAKSGAVPIVMENTAALPFAGLKVYGKSTQNGLPTPTAPVGIEDISQPTISVYSKNLLINTLTTRTTYGITATTDNKDKSITVNGVATGNAFFVVGTATLLPGTYILSGCPSDGAVASYTQYILIDGQYYWDTGSGKTFTITTKKTVEVNIRVMADTAINEKVFYPMIRDASVSDSTYEIGACQTITPAVPNGLPGVPVSSGGNYTDAVGQQWICDEIDLVRGVYIQRIKKISLDGSSSFNISKNHSGSNRWMYCINSLGIDTTFDGRGYCDKLQYNTANAMNADGANTIEASGYSMSNSYSVLYINVGYLLTDNTNTVDGFKAFLAENPMVFYCVLKTPIESKLSVNELTAYNPTTTVLNDSDAEMTVDCIRDVNEAAFEMVLGRSSDSTTNNQTAFPITGSSFYPANGAEYRIDTAITGTYSFVWPDSPFEFWARFTLGNTFNLTFPSGTKYLGAAPSFEAGCTYEMSVKDGVVIVQQVVSE